MAQPQLRRDTVDGQRHWNFIRHWNGRLGRCGGSSHSGSPPVSQRFRTRTRDYPNLSIDEDRRALFDKFLGPPRDVSRYGPSGPRCPLSCRELRLKSPVSATDQIALHHAEGDRWTCFGKVESSPMSGEELEDAAATVYERI